MPQPRVIPTGVIKPKDELVQEIIHPNTKSVR